MARNPRNSHLENFHAKPSSFPSFFSFAAPLLDANVHSFSLRLKGILIRSGALATGSEIGFATVEADGKRMANEIAANLGQFFVTQGWIPPDAVKKSFF